MSELREYFETLLFRILGSERYTQDSPVYPDVWLDFALHPGERRHLLLTPTVDTTAMELAEQLAEQLQGMRFVDARRALAKERKVKFTEVDRQDVVVPARPPEDNPRIAANMTAVVATLTFRELVRCIFPLTKWWREYLEAGRGGRALAWFYDDRKGFRAALESALEAETYKDWVADGDSGSNSAHDRGELPAVIVWLFQIGGTICLAETERVDREKAAKGAEDVRARLRELTTSDNDDVKLLANLVEGLTQAVEERQSDEDGRRMKRISELASDKGAVADQLMDLLKTLVLRPDGVPAMVRDVNRNRRTEVALYRSGKATKADAVRQVFDVRGAPIRWAIIDSGIDARHRAFRRRHSDGHPYGVLRKEERDAQRAKAKATAKKKVERAASKPKDEEPTTYGGGAFTQEADAIGDGWVDNTRVIATYDFTRIRDLLCATDESEIPPDLVRRVGFNQARRRTLDAVQGETRRALQFGSVIDWARLEDYLRIPHNHEYEPPGHFHGTHVAGILGADWRAHEHDYTPSGDRTGIAPEIEIYDLRVLDPDGTGDEFSIMAAMQFIRYLNLRKTGQNQMDVHGANLSFAIRHEVANYACGRTPVCDEAERLVGAGVVVVAAAGNRGRARYQSVKGRPDEGYRSISITDPGNAQSVITVGATHSHEPHTYGVSYFSSRGPTGDGRPKPDLVAPGENIYSTMPDNAEGNTDGTSQATPHVSGAAALLMERNVELIGQPARIKEILCRSATDLGREAYFQGAGMLDILRAMQSV